MDWSMMLPELLDSIAQKRINFCEDYNSFGGVCKSWRSAAMEAARKLPYSNGPPSRLPCLLLSENKKDGTFRELFFLSNSSIRKIRLPEVVGKLCMSSCGWLVTVGEDHATQLINPFSRQTINLPNLETFPQFVETSQWDIGIHKLLLPINPSSSPLSLVVVLWGCSRRLGFWRPGDDKWTHVAGSSRWINDITYYNGQVYCFDCKSNIQVFDVYGQKPVMLNHVSTLPVDVYNDYADFAYIIGLDDDYGRKRLLVAIRELFDDTENELRKEIYKTTSFKVLAYDLENEKWSKVNDFGNKSLFVGFNSSFWVEDNTEVIKGNCIYFTDDLDEVYFRNQSGGGRDMGIYHMSDGTIEPHFTGVSRCHLNPPMWLQSL